MINQILAKKTKSHCGKTLTLMASAMLFNSITAQAQIYTIPYSITGSTGLAGIDVGISGSDGQNLDIISVTASLLHPNQVVAGDIVNLTQYALSGAGGSSVYAYGGKGGYVNSIQDWTEYNAASTNIHTTALAANGGNSTYFKGGLGDVAFASSTVKLGGNGLLNVVGSGGNGGSGNMGGADGANGVAQASGITSLDHSMDVTVSADGGSAGTGIIGAGGNAAKGVVVSAYGQSDTGTVSVSATQTGGNGGAAYHGIDGGGGADSVVSNVVSGSTSGMLTLSQRATGGNGGFSYGSGQGAHIAGDGGVGSSSLNYTDSKASQLNAYVYARGGQGGASDGGVIGKGGNALATLNLTSNNVGAGVKAISQAIGGNAGNSANGIQANATATATASMVGENDSQGAYATGWAQSAVNSNATATSIARSSLTNPAIIATANSNTVSGGLADSQSAAFYQNLTYNIQTDFIGQPTSSVYATAMPTYPTSALPDGGSVVIGEFDAEGNYLTTQSGVSTVTDTVSFDIDTSQIPLTGNIFLSGKGFAVGNLSLSQSESVKINGTIETFTIQIIAHLNSVGAAFGYNFIAYDPVANPNMQNFNQSFSSAKDVNNFYSQNQIFDMGPAVVATPLPNVGFMMLSGLALLWGTQQKRKVVA
ncbi:hypothetical protein [Methylomonas sp. AM2-LC]|uniref:hypothetical protein n=1 Tax=Methylomonas sp. AM2-LC TaxID=3153301 RepID=UPI003263983E